MGYCMRQIKSQFKIKEENIKYAYSALQNLFYFSNKSYDCVNSNSVCDAQTFEETMEAIRWKVELSDNGDVTSIEFLGEKYGDDSTFFFILAPYVEDGSYIMMEGEDGNKWKWIFENKIVENIPIIDESIINDPPMEMELAKQINVNNKGKINIKNTTDGVEVIHYDANETVIYDYIIPDGEIVMLLDYYLNCKNGTEKSDYISEKNDNKSYTF